MGDSNVYDVVYVLGPSMLVDFADRDLSMEIDGMRLLKHLCLALHRQVFASRGVRPPRFS